VKLFFWYALHRRLWTAERRASHGLQLSDTCALCDQAPESVSHLLLGCVFSRQVWFAVLRPLQLQSLQPGAHSVLDTWWLQKRQQLDTSSRPIFDSLTLLISWVIWKERNSRVFNRLPSTVQEVVQASIIEGRDWVLGGHGPVQTLVQLWSQNFVPM